MSSNININNIDITYPIAGQDNDTQGFRDNFRDIRNNFNVASTEISSLQSSVTTLQSTVYGNVNVASYLPTYTGNVSASNSTVSGITSTGSLVVAGNASLAGIVTLSTAIQFANLTTAQVNAITATRRGMTVYNYTTGNIQVYNGTKWANVTLS
jgi:hypothetical protein